jgi:hypothetical protein
MRSVKLTTAALAFGAASLLAGRAQATDCTTLTNPVYVEGSTAIKGVLSQIGAFLSGQSPAVTIVYYGSGSCSGVTSVINAASPAPTPLQTPAGMSNYFTYWTTVGGVVTANGCDIEPPDGGTGSAYLNIGLSDVFATTCAGVTTFPPNVTDYPGPVQAMTFVVPSGSSEYAISAEAAYIVFGFGGINGVKPVAPWSTDQTMYQRGGSSGTQSMISKAISLLPTTAWYGHIETSTGSMVTAITGANMPLTPAQSSTIGIMAAEDVDAQRILLLKGSATDTPRELAYKHFGQNCAYLPDSAPNLFDKRNVRDGHYAIWGPVHAFPVPTSDSNVSMNIATIVGILTGTAQMSGIDLITFEAQNGIIPQCAMAVQRSTEVGPVTPVTQNNAPCGCYYEHIANAVAGKDTACKSCENSTQCPSGYACQIYNSVGYCEGS